MLFHSPRQHLRPYCSRTCEYSTLCPVMRATMARSSRNLRLQGILVPVGAIVFDPYVFVIHAYHQRGVLF